MVKSSSSCWVILPAAGIGQRMGRDIPKQYIHLAGSTILDHTLRKFLSMPCIKGIVIGLREDDAFFCDSEFASHPDVYTVAGGEERSDTVYAALEFLAEKQKGSVNWVLVHDVVRPCFGPDSVLKLIEYCLGHSTAAILATPVTDTIKRKDAAAIATVDRSTLWQAQTPQMFPLQPFIEAFQYILSHQIAVTDDASVYELAGKEVRLVEGERSNLKVTTPEDLFIAETLLKREQFCG